MKCIYWLFLGVGLAACNSVTTKKNIKNDYPIIPQPNALTITDGAFILSDKSTILYHPRLESEANYLSDLLTGIHIDTYPATKQGEPSVNTIQLSIDEAVEHKEAYSLSITEERIMIKAATPTGIFYGIQSLRQLLPETNTKKLSIPTCRISDIPRYPYRGMHLDVSRHFFPIDSIKEYIDMLALHKLNKFHWHLTDDQGWRIEIKKYPRLTEVGGYRAGTAIGRAGSRNAPYTYDSVRYGGYYTQQEIRELVDYAKKRHITVIPEIELPGHSRAALAAYPEYGNTSGPFSVARRWGIFEQVYAPTEETFSFLEDILVEVMDLFPGKYIHIGGDEVLKKEWEESSYAQQLIKDQHLQDEEGLQSYFIQRIEKFLNEHGRSIIGWDEILEGGLAPNATVMSWRGEAGGIAAARQGHPVIMTPGAYCYFDYYQVDPTLHPAEPVNGSDRFTSIEKVYYYNPTPDTLNTQEANYILGAQANVWTEYMPTWKRVQFQVLPRMAALAEVVWTQPAKKDWSDFHSRLQALIARYDQLGYHYADYIVNQTDSLAVKNP